MTKEIVTFNSLVEAKAEKKKRAGIWRPLHTDLIDNKWKVTFVNGDDDPSNSEKSLQNTVKLARKQELQIKLDDDTITFSELKEYLRG